MVIHIIPFAGLLNALIAPAKEKIVGWYHSGPKLKQNDIKINELFRRYNHHSVMVIVDVEPKESDGLPTEAYLAVDEVHDVTFYILLL